MVAGSHDRLLQGTRVRANYPTTARHAAHSVAKISPPQRFFNVVKHAPKRPPDRNNRLPSSN